MKRIKEISIVLLFICFCVTTWYIAQKHSGKIQMLRSQEAVKLSATFTLEFGAITLEDATAIELGLLKHLKGLGNMDVKVNNIAPPATGTGTGWELLPDGTMLLFEDFLYPDSESLMTVPEFKPNIGI